MNKQKVVILDTGVKKNHPQFDRTEIVNLKLNDSQNWEECDDHIVNGHGTAVASVLLKYVNTDIQIISMNIFNKEEESDPFLLISALNYIYQNIECDAINISAGIHQDFPELREVCSLLKEKHIKIVAAFCNSGLISFPAAYDSVIGVDATTSVTRIDEYIYVRGSLVNVGAMSTNQRVAWTDPAYVIVRGNSFITPIITAKICNLLADGVAFIDIESFLSHQAVRNMEFSYEPVQYSKYKTPKQAAIFPLNKETNSLIRFEHMLPFQLTSVYDTKYSGKVGQKVSSANGKETFQIQNIDHCDWDSFDSLILGHSQELSIKSNKNYKLEIIKRCIENDKNIICFDEKDIRLLPTSLQKNIYVPKISRSKKTSNKFGKLYTTYSPVLAVVGTSSQQGKFTFQLKIRELFQADGFKVGQFCTEPEGELFQMDAVYPYGYDGTVDLSGLESIEHVNALMHEIDLTEPDIIIAGTQSGACTVDYNNLSSYTLPTIDVLLGIKPDAVVLCINYHDPIEVVKRSVKFLESLVDCAVVGVCLFPFGYEDEWHAMRNLKTMISNDQLVKRTVEIENELDISCGINGEDDGTLKLYKECIKFFTQC
ncbi:S8 family serine peptidase [Fumia xinanensis]|uniref:S8 family serine peptidase n=1 Tax=Fumia xinanensis TaxID=2763659 RepID=A0A926E4B1_9FIRM|nr:S8 family serine peptidase [Fumia xinanensis]MBC8559265.1 S8 family serine peptidase [Fumia xinanensis]